MSTIKHNTKNLFDWLHALFWVGIIILLLLASAASLFEKRYEGKIYPAVTVDGISFGGKTAQEVQAYWLTQNTPFATVQFELSYNGKVATISGSDLGLGYDATLSATQAYLIGRSPNKLTNMYMMLTQTPVNLAPYFHWSREIVTETLDRIAQDVDVPVEDALFQFENGKVTAFRPAKNGAKLNKEESRLRLAVAFQTAAQTNQPRVSIPLPVETVYPAVSTDKANTFGIKELVGTGNSQFAGSIAGRIHNVALAAGRINGILIKPGETFSFNDALGDISAATGYQSAYIIKNGRTVLGDGGGVCQVSSTLFRAALNAGLPIVERHSHAYRVHFYEDGGFKPGLDATVYSPTYDLKFKNDTPGYLLIQAKTNLKNLTLAFEIYGTHDGRTALITNHKVGGLIPPPEPLYQDDPTLPKGTTKQVDWAAWGTKASFDYDVTRGGETLQDTTFYSNFRPWQAVYLRGTL